MIHPTPAAAVVTATLRRLTPLVPATGDPLDVAEQLDDDGDLFSRLSSGEQVLAMLLAEVAGRRRGFRIHDLTILDQRCREEAVEAIAWWLDVEPMRRDRPENPVTIPVLAGQLDRLAWTSDYLVDRTPIDDRHHALLDLNRALYRLRADLRAIL